MTPTQTFYDKLDTFLNEKCDLSTLLTHQNKTISIDSKCDGGCVFAEFEFGIILGGEVVLFWDSKPEFWRDCDCEQNTDLFSDELETEVKNQIRKYLDREVNEGIGEDMADLIASQKIEARKFRDSVN